MAYFVSEGCGGLRLNTADFTEVNEVITSESMTVGTYTPTYSTGVTAKFDVDKYADTYEKATTTFTASVADLLVSWSDGVNTLTDEDMADVGLSDIVGVVDQSTITVTYAEQEVPRTVLVGSPFMASCGGLKFDDGVFKTVNVNGKRVITLASQSTVDTYVPANCCLLFDGDKFELGDDGELMLV